ncbi:MAG TPA: response regulator [Desulfuromonadales bacterium]|nr:response regulator [Desulfuromonadales bacterium]
MNNDVKILAVDDLALNLELLEVMLSQLDVTLLKAVNGQVALDILAQEPEIDAILLDLEMPVMDGFKTLRIIKEDISIRDIPVIVITADGDEVVKTLALGANDFLAKPFNPEELRLRVMNHVRSKKLNDLTKDMNHILEQEVVKKTAALRTALELSKRAEYEISLRLGVAAEFRDLETGMHTRRISEFSRMLAGLANMTEEEAEILRYASPLHDVGKIGIPDRILLKPGKLDAVEFEIMKKHTEIGGKILNDAQRFPLLDAGRVIALQHHERWDGSGYPHGLAGTEIHPFARIVSIVDVFDALTSERPYKKAFTLEKTESIMMEDQGTFFDPQLLKLFFEHIDRFVTIKDAMRDLPCEENITYLQHVVI